MPLKEETNQLATLIPQCMLDVEGEFFLFEVGGWYGCFPWALLVKIIGLEVSSLSFSLALDPHLFPSL